MLQELRLTPLAVSALAGVFVCASAHAVILNPGLNGPVATGAAPPDWFEWQKTPDTCDASGPFNNTPNPWALSPDGGTFVRAGGSDFANAEAIGQDVTGFTGGTSYQIDAYITNLGHEHPTSGDWLGQDGYWELYVNGSLASTSVTLSKPAANTDSIVWSSQSFTFVAPSSDFEIAFVSRSSAGLLAAYMGIDGLHLSEIPTPGSAIGLAAFAVAGAARRRRRA